MGRFACGIVYQDEVEELLEFEELNNISEQEIGVLKSLKEVNKYFFAECGIAFKNVPNFKGVPVQEFIKKLDDGSMILCMTLR